ncbi:GFA family protein [Wenxinia marina]|uniref:CENP-V/GFA domain-containing protein n=1 Tax=Wenxinia marina DSM 24838 TaxID=1123501 RepID=A0A0D0QJI4_9RHOB|nr:hypothetical protein [Wenxinia marina]KIQ71173.1 hypothetical protein Wenmar_00552 [Wenxinia marina DSM 24838]GGL54275.1 aldehyde-activating protein [Wenxinia marina]
MIEGRCLCGAAGWRLDGDPEGTTICNCSICRRYGAIWAYGHLGQELTPWGETAAFATGEKSCDFHHCAVCGCVTHYLARWSYEDGRTKCAVNLRMADDPQAIRDLKIFHFEGAISMEDVVPDETGTVARHVRDLWL